jgi:hypothetical protein
LSFKEKIVSGPVIDPKLNALWSQYLFAMPMLAGLKHEEDRRGWYAAMAQLQDLDCDGKTTLCESRTQTTKLVEEMSDPDGCHRFRENLLANKDYLDKVVPHLVYSRRSRGENPSEQQVLDQFINEYIERHIRTFQTFLDLTEGADEEAIVNTHKF